MTRYLVKFTYVPNPVLIDSENFKSDFYPGIYTTWFRTFLGDMHEVEWCKKV